MLALPKLSDCETQNPEFDSFFLASCFQTVMLVLKKLLNGNEHNSTLFVPFAQLSFNNKVAALTGSTPFSLMFGRSLNEIKDYTDNKEEGTIINIDIQDWKKHMDKIQSLIYPAIIDRTLAKKDKMLKSLDKQHKLLTTSSFPTGSIVMLKDPNRSNKFEPKYIGPYQIVRRTRNGNFILKDQQGDLVDRMIPPDQLKLVSKKPRKQDKEAVYIIEKILNHRGEPGTYEYYTKFKSYRTPEWIPEENFQDTALISDYWKSERPQ